MKTPAHHVIQAFGTARKASASIGRADNYFSRLISDGDGVVPMRMAAVAVEIAEREGLELTWNDMRPPRALLDIPGVDTPEGAAA